MLGAIAGDVIGSVYEFDSVKQKEFPLFTEWSKPTDDTVLTVAVAEALLTGRGYVELFHQYFADYPLAGYGGSFVVWAGSKHTEPYNSWGNGSAMRVSPVAYARDTLAEVLAEAERSAAVTHNHPEGIRGARAVAGAVFLARTGKSKDEIRAFVTGTDIGYTLPESLDAIRPTYRFHVSCQKSVPEAIQAFLEATDFEDALRNAISLGGDADTQACVAGAIAEPFFGGVPKEIAGPVWEKLDDRLRGFTEAFRAQFGIK
jgi:ADP-ribosylglycohydrolase